MSNLFSLPRVHSASGAKLYFRATGTSTPQATYTDIDLTVPHANPVVADSEGYFDPIYLDPSLPDYRVIHTNGSDPGNDYTLETLLEPILDDIPAAQATHTLLRVKSASPTVIFEETDQSAGNKKWWLQANGNVLTLAALDDAESTATGGFSISRAGAVSVGGNTVSTYKSESFTATLTGMSATTTGLMMGEKTGGVATLYVNPSSGEIVGTSNSTAMTLTGIPSAYRPKNTTLAACHGLVNNTTGPLLGVASISSAGVITFQLGSPPAAFTGSGSKGLSAGFSLVYPL